MLKPPLAQSLTAATTPPPSSTRSQTAPANLFLSHNPSLGPPYRVLVDTNFINHSLQNKLELVQGMMDCLFAKCASCFAKVLFIDRSRQGGCSRQTTRGHRTRCAVASLARKAITLRSSGAEGFISERRQARLPCGFTSEALSR